MMVMGLQVRPTRTSRSSRTMPSSPKRTEAAGPSACSTLLQHWMGAVLHWLAGIGVGSWRATGVAAAKVARAAREAKTRVNCIVRLLRGVILILNCWDCSSEDLRVDTSPFYTMVRKLTL